MPAPPLESAQVTVLHKGGQAFDPCLTIKSENITHSQSIYPQCDHTNEGAKAAKEDRPPDDRERLLWSVNEYEYV